MHDLKAIRDNPEAFDVGLKRRGLPPMAAEILLTTFFAYLFFVTTS